MNQIIEQLEADASRLAKQAIVEQVLTQQGKDGAAANGLMQAPNHGLAPNTSGFAVECGIA